MEGVGRGNFVHANFNFSSNLPMLFSPSPPISAIDKFLLGRGNGKNPTRFPFKPDPKTTLIARSTKTLDGFCGFSSSSSSTNNDRVNVADSWPTMQDIKFANELFSDAGGCMDSYHRVSINGDHHDPSFVSDEKRSNGKKRKASNAFIKGQWTEEEDRKLMKLVTEYGYQKWALIAEKLVGRAGKQCRERWYNHLRPDIKKDSWSEEEETILVEAHIEFGNRWAEIARRIPGRTENSIKNHWNTTKRRQYSMRRKNKKVTSDGGRTSLLQEYIKSQNPDNNDENNLSNNDQNIPNPAHAFEIQYENPILESSDEYFDSSPLTRDEFVFMQAFFNNSNLNPPRGNHHHNYQVDLDQEQLMGSSNPLIMMMMMMPDEPTFDFAAENFTPTFYSDSLMYSLTEGAQDAPDGLMMVDYQRYDQMMIMEVDQAGFGYSNVKKDMDLIEMVTSSQFSLTSSSSSY